MTHNRVGYCVRSLLVTSAVCATLSSSFAAATNIDLLTISTQTLHQCTQTVGRVDRLACFDRLFETPLEVLTAEEPLPAFVKNVDAEDGPLEHQARLMEKGRETNDRNWQFRFGSLGHPARFRWEDIQDERSKKKSKRVSSTVIPEKVEATFQENRPEPVIEPGATNVYLSMKEFRSADTAAGEKPAILLLSCVADITTAALILNGPLPARRVPLRVLLKDQQIQDDMWQAAESKRVLISPRGLTSIAHINRWSQVERVQFEVDIGGQSRAYLFETANLKDLLKPIRRACHW
ncbi:hypothetical protein PsAD2_04569 [Pseudovibrio axinellae]|uniref:Type VI secretion-associated protein, VC_A0118 family n=1 Tax=Pseudovibrio axinellae TaxID=989403 RepID=A0A165SYD8_9HYPH|nr:type VI secretion system-associated protein TagO [Pseudovibrio axinellae]KZL05018.1 hypothetical protein PsAD2_04569 [Pseudovibrio axinellae]SER64956.1 type VI secretion system protein VasI [Pseudovibrio axinellae]